MSLRSCEFLCSLCFTVISGYFDVILVCFFKVHYPVFSHFVHENSVNVHNDLNFHGVGAARIILASS